jgi:energy-converting hydrogenase A subunit M
MFSFQHKEGNYSGFGFFSFLLKKTEERKARNMLSLMLDPRFFKNRLVSPLIGHEQGKAIVEEYDKKSLFPMLLKCYYHLHPLVESKRGVVDEKVEEDMTLDIFEN